MDEEEISFDGAADGAADNSTGLTGAGRAEGGNAGKSGGNGGGKKPKKKMSKKKKALIITASVLVVLGVAAGVVVYVFFGGHVHNMKYGIAVPAGCTQGGNTAYYYCEDCGKYFSDFLGEQEISYESTRLPATGHDMTFRAAAPATCTEEGYLVPHYYCANCGLAFADEQGDSEVTDYIIAPSGHEFSQEGYIVTEPGCETEGERVFRCLHEGCDAVRRESVPAAHRYADEYTAETVNALEHWLECAVCGAEKPGSRHYHDYITDSSLSACSCGEQIEYSEGLEYALSEDGSYYIVTGAGAFVGENLFIPAVRNGIPVKKIAANAFSAYNFDSAAASIRTVRLPEGLEEIGENAFYMCTRIDLVTLPSSLGTIGAFAFFGCTSLKDIVIPAGVECIREQAFCQTGLESAIFEQTSGWTYGGEDVPPADLGDKAQAAALLKREEGYNALVRITA